jgi:hypothetical protein
MKIILTESQFGRLNKSSQQITNAIIKYMNEYIADGDRKIEKKSRNFGNLREEWCINGKNTISTTYYFDKGEFKNGYISVSKNIINKLSNLFSVRPSYLLHVIEEWYDETMVPKFEKIIGETGLSISEIISLPGENDCIPEPVKPEGITDEEMIDYITKNTLYKREQVVDKVESGEEDLEDLYLQIVDIQNRKKIRGI